MAKGYNTVDPGDDIIDSRDAIAKLEVLYSDVESEYEDCITERAESEATDETPDEEREELEEKERKNFTIDDYISQNQDSSGVMEYLALKEFCDEGESFSDWHHGETFIHENYFEKYAEQFADDIGAINSNMEWPLTHINWETAAEELKHDYSAIEYDGHTYYARD
jgi:hypothetical protein